MKKRGVLSLVLLLPILSACADLRTTQAVVVDASGPEPGWAANPGAAISAGILRGGHVYVGDGTSPFFFRRAVAEACRHAQDNAGPTRTKILSTWWERLSRADAAATPPDPEREAAMTEERQTGGRRLFRTGGAAAVLPGRLASAGGGRPFRTVVRADPDPGRTPSTRTLRKERSGAMDMGFVLEEGGLVAATALLGRWSFREFKRVRELKRTGGLAGPSGAVPFPKNVRLPYRPFVVAGIRVADEVPMEHLLLAGTIGVGKSQALHGMLDRILFGCDERSSLEKALVCDSGGEFFRTRGGKNDRILNPFDGRTLAWNPFREIQDEDSDFTLLAKSCIPDNPRSGAPEWVGYGRNLLIDIMKIQAKELIYNPREVCRLVVSAPQEELAALLSGTASEILTHPASEKMLASVRFECKEGLLPWMSLPEDGDFSIRTWIREGAGALFLTYRDNQVDELRGLIGSWLSLAIRETLSLSPDRDRRVWFVMDELDSLGKVEYLPEALARGRKYGLACIGAIQSVSQLDFRYGHDLAKVLRSTFRNKIIMAQGSESDAEIWSREIGDEEAWTDSHSSSTSGNGGGGSGTNRQLQVRRLVLPSELMALPKLEGYVRLSDRAAIEKFRIPLVKYKEVLPAFVSKGNALAGES